MIPGDAKIERKYRLERGAKLAGDYCESCQSPYKRKSNRQKYCPPCSKEEERKKKNYRNRKYRMTVS
ncbi:Sjogren's syndrome/scleroderma autoantigen 1 family protein [Peribacillus glennii]|uniref:Sjogren's syndrome/scleroderma autoantigen 1 family protein n=1 Tax=Peribacillus glennii TaxID=2303991 RepID=UPI00389A9B82